MAIAHVVAIFWLLIAIAFLIVFAYLAPLIPVLVLIVIARTFGYFSQMIDGGVGYTLLGVENYFIALSTRYVDSLPYDRLPLSSRNAP